MSRSFDDSAASRAFPWFLLFALLFLAAGMGLRAPWPADEPRFMLLAQQMLASGDWLFPRRGIELYSDKPPMLMWWEAASFQLLHNWRLAFLLPSLLAGLGTLILIYDLGRRLWNPRVGLIAAALLLASLQFTQEVKRGQIDALNMFWMSLSNWGLMLHCLRGPNWRAYWLGCFAAGLGVITKGVGFLSLALLLPYMLARRWHWPGVSVTSRSGWRWAGGGLAFVLAIGMWLLPMLIAVLARHNAVYDGYARDILLRQTAGRYAHSWAHLKAWWFYLPVLMVDWFPLCLLYLPMLPRWRAALRQRDPRLLLPLMWWAMLLVFFSIPDGKRSIYLLPLLPMVCLAMAPYLGQLWQCAWLQGLGFTLCLIAGLAYTGLGSWAWLTTPSQLAQRFALGSTLPHQGQALWQLAVVVGLAFLLAAALGRIRRGGWALLAGMTSTWLVYCLAVYPLIDPSRSNRQLMQQADQLIGPQSELGLVDWREEQMLQAIRKPIDFGVSRSSAAQLQDALIWQAQEPNRRWIMLDNKALNHCIDLDKAYLLERTHRRVSWWLFNGQAVHPRCRVSRGSLPMAGL